ncbi:MAG TPA: hypothetical protein O0X97_05905 [Methanocorpusculum sp.]|nr:hypothetical protein [Methanocorpusculum sp.]
MDEIAKTEARNYLSAAGFFLLVAFSLLDILTKVGNSTFIEMNTSLMLVIGIGLLIIATLLIVLRKRDMISILFIMMGFMQLFYAFSSPETWYLILFGFLVLIAVVTLTAKEKIKWLLFLIPAVYLVRGLFVELQGINNTVIIVTHVILAVLCLYFALACASERFSLPGRKLLTADESTEFKASGSVLGYMLFALLTGGYALHYILGETVLPLETFVTIEHLCGILMIFVAILLFAVGKMRFTPVMFLLLGLTGILAMYSTGSMFIGLGILYIVIGLFAMLRKESRILPGIMLIIYGCTGFFTAFAGGNSPVASIILNAIPCLIAIYLAFVVYSQRKLPKF